MLLPLSITYMIQTPFQLVHGQPHEMKMPFLSVRRLNTLHPLLRLMLISQKPRLRAGSNGQPRD